MSLLTGITKLLPSLHLSGKLCWSRCPLTWPSAKWQLMASYPWRKCVPLFLHFNCFVFDGFLRKFGWDLVVADPIVGLALDVADREDYARFAGIIFSGCSVRTSWLTATSRGRRSTLLRLTPDRCFLQRDAPTPRSWQQPSLNAENSLPSMLTKHFETKFAESYLAFFEYNISTRSKDGFLR